MICGSCRERRHEACRGGSWCDCQHQDLREDLSPERAQDPVGSGDTGHIDPDLPAPNESPEKPNESALNWKRQG